MASCLFLLLGLGTLDLGGTTESLLSVLALLACCEKKTQSQPLVQSLPVPRNPSHRFRLEWHVPFAISVHPVYEEKSGSVHTLLSGSLLDLLGHANTDKAVVGLELLHGLGGVVDKGEASGLAATELGAQAEDGDLVLAGLVHAGKLVAELILGDVGTVGVQDVTIQKKDQRLAKRVFLQSKAPFVFSPSLSLGPEVRVHRPSVHPSLAHDSSSNSDDVQPSQPSICKQCDIICRSGRVEVVVVVGIVVVRFREENRGEDSLFSSQPLGALRPERLGDIAGNLLEASKRPAGDLDLLGTSF